MLSFKDFIYLNEDVLNEAVNKHSTHIEELIFVEGRKGLAKAIAGLSYIAKTIGTAKINNSISTKIDGAPAVFFGYSKNGFFVSTKSIFNKEPKLNYTEKDIRDNHPAGLADTLVYCLKYLKSVTPNTIGFVYQGDVLFTKASLKSVSIDGADMWSFQPNTINYTVEKKTPIGNKIGSSSLGVAVHTKYIWDGMDPTTLKVTSFGISKSTFGTNKNVFIMDTHNTSTDTGFSKEEYANITSKIEKLKSLCTNKFDDILNQPALGINIMTFTNTYIRNNVIMPDPIQREKEFLSYMTDKMNADIDSKKTAKGKESAKAKYAFIEDAKKYGISDYFKIFDMITEIKLIILKKLNSLSLFHNFVIKTNGDMERTGEEGFVISTTSARGCKLVDRYTFSHNNFSADIIKGWEHP